MPLLVEQGSVVDPQTGTKFVPNGRVWAMTHGFIVAVAGEQGPITLVDRRSRERWRLRNPSQISGYQGGVDEAAVHPNGRLLALSFADPAFGRTQVTDVWLLDPARRRFQQLPDMPALVLLKFTSMSWASDGRLVILAESAGRNVVGVWRPSQRRIAVRRVSLPTRSGGSDSFVVWR